MSKIQFINDDEDYSIEEFYKIYKNNLPKVVKVTQGYYGDVRFETFDRDQVFRIHTYSAQKRVVAELIGGTNIAGVTAHFISLPVKYKMMFCVIKSGQSIAPAIRKLRLQPCADIFHGKRIAYLSDLNMPTYARDFVVLVGLPKPDILEGGKDDTLKNILDKHKLPVEVEFSKTKGHSKIKIGSMERSSSQVVRLRLMDTYEDYYLLGNAISEGSLYGKVSAMPVYLPDLRLSLVTGLKAPFSERYEAILKAMDNKVEQHITFDPHYGNKDIAVYSQKEVKGHIDYAYVLPAKYYNESDIFTDGPNSKNGNYEELQKELVSQASIYDIIPADKSVYEPITPRNSTFTATDGTSNLRNRKPPPPVLPKPKRDARQSLKPTSLVPSQQDNHATGTFQKPQLRSNISSASEKQIPMISKSGKKPPVPPPKTPEMGQADVSCLHLKPPTFLRKSSEENTTEKRPTITSISEDVVVSNMSIEDIGEWLVRLKLEKYVENFKENQIDGVILLELDEDILKETFNMQRLEAMKLMKFARTGYVPKSRFGTTSSSNE